MTMNRLQGTEDIGLHEMTFLWLIIAAGAVGDAGETQKDNGQAISIEGMNGRFGKNCM